MNLIKLTPEEKEIINITTGRIAKYLSYYQDVIADQLHRERKYLNPEEHITDDRLKPFITSTRTVVSSLWRSTACVNINNYMNDVNDILQRYCAEDSDLVTNYFTDDDTFKSVKDTVDKKFTGNNQEDISLLICGSFLDAVNTNLQTAIKNAVLDNIDDPQAAVALITDAADHAVIARFMALEGLKRYLQAVE